MERQHTENLFRRYKGKVVTVRSVSGSVYKGTVEEITNDYVLLTADKNQNFVLFEAIESIVIVEAAS